MILSDWNETALLQILMDVNSELLFFLFYNN